MALGRAILVQKYGGSSLADLAALRGVAQRIVDYQRQGRALVVVVSAMGHTTEGLLAQGWALADRPPRRELDMLVTAGERICMALLCIAIDACGGTAISLTGSQSGIITNNQHQGARILAVSPQRIQAALAKGQVVVVAGYQGVSQEREVTTLGRGGSDTSAVALAAALGAQACEIYSDVDGVFTADPRCCPQAQLLAQVDYDTMQTLSESGAKVLHAAAVAFAKRAHIRILARRTGGDPAVETVVAAATATTESPFAAYGRPLAVAHLADMSYLQGGWLACQAQLWDALGVCGGRILATDGHGVWVDRAGMRDRSPTTLAVIAQCLNLRAVAWAWVTLVGDGPMDLWMQSCLEALGRAEVAVQAALLRSQALCMVVSPAALGAAIHALHDLVIKADSQSRFALERGHTP